MCLLGTLLNDVRTSDFITLKITVVVQMNLVPTINFCNAIISCMCKLQKVKIDTAPFKGVDLLKHFSSNLPTWHPYHEIYHIPTFDPYTCVSAPHQRLESIYVPSSLVLQVQLNCFSTYVSAWYTRIKILKFSCISVH